MKRSIVLVLLCSQLLSVADAQSSVDLTIDASSPQKQIPADFSGLSFETGSLRYNNHNYATNACFFSPTNTHLLMLFKNLGIKSLRIGGNSADRGNGPSTNEIDSFFGFVKAADVKVVYSLRLANGNAAQDASIANYVWNSYRPYLISLAIGNEANSYNGMDPEMTNSALFIAKWNKFASAVTGSVPDVILGGPDNGNGATSWVSAFAQAEKSNSHVAYIFSHYEPGGPSRKKTAQQVMEEMLSPDCDTKRCPSCYEKIGKTALSSGLGYRFTEANSHVAAPDSQGVNHSFATALFALDFLYWWAGHDCAGVNFHTGLHGYNAGLFLGKDGDYGVHPISYGIAAFNVGGHGAIDSMAIKNSDKLNLTAYAVTDTNNNLFVTIINREHGENARNALVKINATGRSESVMYLKAPENNIAATNGVTLGGAIIDGKEAWAGKWDPIDSSNASGCEVNVNASSAAIVKVTGAKILSQ